MNSNKRLPRTNSEKLDKDFKNRCILKNRPRSVFYQRHSSRTSYHSRNDWLQYRINSVTWVPSELQQKINIAINYRLDAQIILVFSARTWYVKWFLYCVVSFCVCWKYIEKIKKLIIIHKYKKKWDESNHNSNNCNI